MSLARQRRHSRLLFIQEKYSDSFFSSFPAGSAGSAVLSDKRVPLPSHAALTFEKRVREPPEPTLLRLLRDNWHPEAFTKALDRHLSQQISPRTMQRLERVLQILLMAALAEKRARISSAALIISEYTTLAACFFDAPTAHFVNGLLDHFFQDDSSLKEI